MRMNAALVALTLTATALSGCIGADGDELDAASLGPVDDLSPVLFDILDGESVWIDSTTDEARLHTRLFKPDLTTHELGDAWEAPTILVMSPYFGDDAREDPNDPSSRPTYYRYQWLIEHFVPRGYVVAFSDVRGTGDSGGCFRFTEEDQRQDGHDIVEWLAAQDWSNGRVGMFGKSYDAETQQGTAITAPPHLTTIVPVASISTGYEWFFYDGVPFTLQTLIGTGFYQVSDGLQVPRSVEGLSQYPARLPCQPEMWSKGLDRDGDWDEFWQRYDFRSHVENIEASVLYVHGLQDWNVRNVAIRDWFDLIPSEKRALLGQWAHDYPEENRWNEDWSRTDWRDTVHAWYDHYLLGVDNGILERLPVVQVQDTAGVWRGEPTWPVHDAVELELHLGDGTLSVEPTTELEDAPLVLRENEEAFARSMGPEGMAPIPDVDTAPASPILWFESEPFAAETHVSGWTTLTFDVTLSDGLYPDPDTVTDAHFAANLYLLTADGEATWYNSGYLSARHRDGIDAPAEVPEDERITYELRFHPEETVIPEGARIVMSLAGSDRGTEPEGTFWAGALHGGALSLPVIERDWEAAQLPVPFGEACTSVEC